MVFTFWVSLYVHVCQCVEMHSLRFLLLQKVLERWLGTFNRFLSIRRLSHIIMLTNAKDAVMELIGRWISRTGAVWHESIMVERLLSTHGWKLMCEVMWLLRLSLQRQSVGCFMGWCVCGATFAAEHVSGLFFKFVMSVSYLIKFTLEEKKDPVVSFTITGTFF